MEFASMIAGGINSVRASVSNLFARGYNETADQRVDRKYVVDEIGQLVLVSGVPAETGKEKIQNTIGDLATIALAVAGGPEGMLMSQGGKAPAMELAGEIKKTASMSVVKKGTSGWQDAIKTIQTQKKSDFLVETASDAKTLLLGAPPLPHDCIVWYTIIEPRKLRGFCIIKAPLFISKQLEKKEFIIAKN